MTHVHSVTQQAREYILANGGSIEQNDTYSYEVYEPYGETFIGCGGYSFHRGRCTLYAYTDGSILDVTIETADHRVSLRKLQKSTLEYFDSSLHPALHFALLDQDGKDRAIQEAMEERRKALAEGTKLYKFDASDYDTYGGVPRSIAALFLKFFPDSAFPYKQKAGVLDEHNRGSLELSERQAQAIQKAIDEYEASAWEGSDLRIHLTQA